MALEPHNDLFLFDIVVLCVQHGPVASAMTLGAIVEGISAAARSLLNYLLKLPTHQIRWMKPHSERQMQHVSSYLWIVGFIEIIKSCLCHDMVVWVKLSREMKVTNVSREDVKWSTGSRGPCMKMSSWDTVPHTTNIWTPPTSPQGKTSPRAPPESSSANYPLPSRHQIPVLSLLPSFLYEASEQGCVAQWFWPCGLMWKTLFSVVGWSGQGPLKRVDVLICSSVAVLWAPALCYMSWKMLGSQRW